LKNQISGNNMTRMLIKIFFLAGIMCIPVRLAASGPDNDSIQLNSPVSGEKFYLFTDRSLYAAGEKVLFRVFNVSHTLLKQNSWSRVIYIELINNHNLPVAKGKFMLNSAGASGQIDIPDTLTTGYYYIRAYTRWMRNYSPSAYCHVPLVIVNPYKTSTEEYEKLAVKSDVSGVIGSGYVNGIRCIPDKPTYGKREKVILNLEEVYPGIAPDGYCITVIKNGYLDTDYFYDTRQEENIRLNMSGEFYYPETKGLSISGYVTGGEDKHPVANSSIFLTLLGNDPDCLEFKTGEGGKINMSIPHHTGSRDILLTVDTKEDKDIQIILDDEFSNEYSGMPASTINFFLDRKELVEEAMVNNQVKKSFMSAMIDTIPVTEIQPAYTQRYGGEGQKQKVLNSIGGIW